MISKNILIINAHPDKESYNFGLSEAYKKGALNSNADVKQINIRDLKFNPNLEFGYQKIVLEKNGLSKLKNLVK